MCFPYNHFEIVNLTHALECPRPAGCAYEDKVRTATVRHSSSTASGSAASMAAEKASFERSWLLKVVGLTRSVPLIRRPALSFHANELWRVCLVEVLEETAPRRGSWNGLGL